MKVGQVRRRGIVTRTGIAACLAGGLAMGLLAGTTVAASAHSSPLIGQAKRDLLVLSDLPSGWTSTKSSNNNSSFPGAAQLASCLGVPKSIITNNPPTASSPEFDSKNHLQSVNDSVQIYPSAKGGPGRLGFSRRIQDAVVSDPSSQRLGEICPRIATWYWGECWQHLGIEVPS